ncbi:MAG TPA: hypothetical protein VEG64_15530 [Candidatus Sulfotelmatobacter sp.]|nr:hypothetical protein [Candidatus Sulfotelmatobacter sp.]
MEPQESQPEPERSSFPAAFIAGAIVVLLLLGAVLLIGRRMQPRGSAASITFPFGAAEQAYAEHVHFKDIQMARATNFLNQEFTYISGIMSNDGARTLHGLEVQLEFHDPFKQVILREKQQLVGPGTRPLEGGERRSFQITLEHVPAEWDQQYPSIRVTGMIVE